MNSISAVKYFSNGTLVHTMLQFKIEVAIISENSAHFKLAFLSLLFQSLLIDKFGILGELPTALDLVHLGVIISNNNLNQLLYLFNKLNNVVITSAITPQ